MVRRGCGGIGMLLFLGIFAIVGVAIMVWGGVILRNAYASTNWPTANGEVVHSTITENSDEDGTTYGADIWFAYVVNDQQYENDTVTFGQYSSSNRRHASEIVRRYPVGTQVSVYYNPDEPETSVLEPGATWSSYMVLAMGAGFFCFSGLFVLIMLAQGIGLLRS